MYILILKCLCHWCCFILHARAPCGPLWPWVGYQQNIFKEFFNIFFLRGKFETWGVPSLHRCLDKTLIGSMPMFLPYSVISYFDDYWLILFNRDEGADMLWCIYIYIYYKDNISRQSQLDRHRYPCNWIDFISMTYARRYHTTENVAKHSLRLQLPINMLKNFIFQLVHGTFLLSLPMYYCCYRYSLVFFYIFCSCFLLQI